MALVTITFPIDRYVSLVNGSTATLVVLPLSLGIVKGSSIEIIEVDALGVPTGLYTHGVVDKIVAGQFFSVLDTSNMYYIISLVHFS